MSYSFRGGVSLVSKRELTMHKPLVDLENVSVVRIPLSGSGIDFSPVVNPGDPVRMGQVIGESSLLSRFSIRSSVSGTVREISDGVLPDGSAVPFVTIENDGLDTLEPLSRAMDWQMMEPDSILDTICASGIVDRTGYPVFAMLGRQISSTDTLIVCGLDGEVWTSAVYRTLCDEAEDIVEGIHVLMRLFGRVRCIVAMPESAGEATDSMRAAAGSDNRIRFLALRDKYPQTDARLLIRTITGRDAAGDLSKTRCAVLGAQETAAIGRALRAGIPDLSRIVTVSGDAVAAPRNLRVRAGTAWYEIVHACGGYLETPKCLLVGDVMHGAASFTDNISFMPGQPGFVALSDEAAEEKPAEPCIGCGRCAQVCPYALIPAQVRALLENGQRAVLSRLPLAQCTLCGACAYVCPAHIRLAQVMRRALEEREENEDGRE